MPSQGSLIVRVFTSDAQIPIRDATITVIQKNEGVPELLALRLTDESGRAAPVTIPAPDIEKSLSPSPVRPFSEVNVAAEEPLYKRVVVENVQIFPDTVTVQELQLIPLDELPESWDETQVFNVVPQNL